MTQPRDSDLLLTRRDWALASAIAATMLSVFLFLGSGRSILVTFVPGLAVAWCTLTWAFCTRHPLPTGNRALVPYVATLALQFLHFAEEYVGGFAHSYPHLYGGADYSLNLFVVFNMCAYAGFTVAALGAFVRRLGFLWMPVLFFAIYGALGNAIAHTVWTVMARGYFPGWYTSLAYVVVAPLLLGVLLGRRLATTVVIIMIAVLVPTLVMGRG